MPKSLFFSQSNNASTLLTLIAVSLKLENHVLPYLYTLNTPLL